MNQLAHARPIRLIAGTPEVLQQALRGRAALAQALGVRVPEDWVESRLDTLRHTLDKLRADAGAAEWWTYLLVHQPDNTLVGSGGYHGPPTAAGAVGLGYEVAEEYQGRGLATAFAGALVAQAFARPPVRAIIAHTLARSNASVRVLLNHGFAKVADLEDPADGPLWQWKLERPGLLQQG